MTVYEDNEVVADGFGDIPSENVATKSGKTYVEGCLPEIEGRISLKPIDMDEEIVVYDGLRILDAIETEDGPIHMDFGNSQEVFARGIFVKVFNQDAFNQRWLKIQLLLDVQRFMQSHPEGGYCKTIVGLKFLKPSKKNTVNQTQFKAPRIKR